MLRLALIHGCQNAAADYAAAVRRLRGVTIAAVVQPEDAARQSLASTLGVTAAARSLEELLALHRDEFDAVLIRGSVAQRTELACLAAEAKKHVCLTSPAATTVSDIDRIEAACLAAGMTLLIGSRRRFEPSTLAVKSALDSGKLGAPALLRMHHWLPRESVEKDRGNKSAPRQAGRNWSEIVNHLELAEWIFGRAPSEIFAQGLCESPEPLHWPESLQIHLGFPDGGMALISLAFGLPIGAEYDVFSVIGTSGAAYSDVHHQLQLKFLGGDPRAVRAKDDILTRAAQLKAFVSAIAGPSATRESALAMKQALRLEKAAWTSLTERQALKLTGGPDVARA